MNNVCHRYSTTTPVEEIEQISECAKYDVKFHRNIYFLFSKTQKRNFITGALTTHYDL